MDCFYNTYKHELLHNETISQIQSSCYPSLPPDGATKLLDFRQKKKKKKDTTCCAILQTNTMNVYTVLFNPKAFV